MGSCSLLRRNHNVSVPSRAAPSALRADSDPWILHFAGNVKPWRYVMRNAPHEQYFRYLDMTPWKGWRPAPTPVSTMIGFYVNASVNPASGVSDGEVVDACDARADETVRLRGFMSAVRAALPALSYDSDHRHFRTITRVVRQLGEQTARSDVELVIVCPSAAALQADEQSLTGFASVIVKEVGALHPLSTARAVGVHADGPDRLPRRDAQLSPSRLRRRDYCRASRAVGRGNPRPRQRQRRWRAELVVVPARLWIRAASPAGRTTRCCAT